MVAMTRRRMEKPTRRTCLKRTRENYGSTTSWGPESRKEIFSRVLRDAESTRMGPCTET